MNTEHGSIFIYFQQKKQRNKISIHEQQIENNKENTLPIEPNDSPREATIQQNGTTTNTNNRLIQIQ